MPASRALVIRTNHVGKGRQSRIILDIRIDGILDRRVLSKIVFINNGSALCDLFTLLTVTAFEESAAFLPHDRVKHVVAIGTELHDACVSARII